MGSLFRVILRLRFLNPLLKPLMRFVVGMVAIPLFRAFLKNVVRLQELDQELEKDLEQWFRGSLLLLVASANMENLLFGWVPPRLSGSEDWLLLAFRILLAIGVIEAMPDQELFAIIHPGPPRLKWPKEPGLWRELRQNWQAIATGLLCQHLNRSSPVFAILTAILVGPIGWVCYGVAVVQYLIIGLVTSRDKALDVLSEFDRRVAIRRRELMEEFGVRQADDPADASRQPGESRRDSHSSGRTDGAPDEPSSGPIIVSKDEDGYLSERSA